MFYVIFIGIGILLGVIASLMTASRKKKLATYTGKAQAVVTSVIQKKANRNSSSMWYPTFEYDYQNQHYQKESNAGTSEQIYQKGQIVPIQINPQKPEQFILVESKGFQLAVRILWAIAVFFVLGTILVAVLISSH